ncbi:MAG: galactokinase [Bacillota bacterium]|nr:galactokinase [Bacillota bacterium]
MYLAKAAANFAFFFAPARVNLIGEHIDYNGGHVFPAALTLMNVVAVRKRGDRIIRLAADDLAGLLVTASLDNLDKYKGKEWGSYQLGVADELIKAGYNVPGCDMLFWGNVPFGSGLSSSASIEVATAVALSTLGLEEQGNAVNLDMTEMAVISQRAENNYVGVNCGVMDQFASANGKKDHAIFLDCRSLDFSLVPIKMEGCSIVISNTKKPRSLADSKYNERRAQCEQGLALLKPALPGINYLCEITPEQLEENIHLIKDEVIAKRVRHCVYEEDRVRKSMEVLHSGDIEAFGKLLCASHDSLRDLYEVTGKELDTLVEAALKVDGTLGSRMTGAGFGGCTVSIVKNEALETFRSKVSTYYTSKTGLFPEFYVSEIGDGAGIF